MYMYAACQKSRKCIAHKRDAEDMQHIYTQRPHAQDVTRQTTKGLPQCVPLLQVARKPLQQQAQALGVETNVRMVL